jgi:hypothetical protein
MHFTEHDSVIKQTEKDYLKGFRIFKNAYESFCTWIYVHRVTAFSQEMIDKCFQTLFVVWRHFISHSRFKIILNCVFSAFDIFGDFMRSAAGENGSDLDRAITTPLGHYDNGPTLEPFLSGPEGRASALQRLIRSNIEYEKRFARRMQREEVTARKARHEEFMNALDQFVRPISRWNRDADEEESEL